MLDRLFGGKKDSGHTSESKPLAPAIRAAVMSAIGIKGIPPMPSGAQKAFQLATNPTAEIRDFVEVIQSDEALSARVVKIANSVYFDRGKRSETIEEAINIIGLNELRCLLNATSLAELLPSKHPFRPQLWANDVATALISRQLAQTILPSKTEIAFLAGLMHDIGKLLLIQRAPEEYNSVIRKITENGRTFCEAEEEIFLFNHTEVGDLIGERWNFSTELRDVIRSHHSHTHPATNPVTEIVNCADLVAHSLGIGHQKGFNRLRLRCEEQLADALSALNIPENDRKQFVQDMLRTYETEHELYSGQIP